MSEKDEKNLNPKLKDFSIKELSDEVSNRSKLYILATDERIAVKAGADLLQLMGLAFKVLMEITMILKSAEMKPKPGGIVVPGFKPPTDINRN